MHVGETLFGDTKCSERYAVHALWHDVDEFGREQKYRGLVFFDERCELFVNTLACFAIGTCASFGEQTIHAAVRIEREVETGVVPLRRMPKGKKIERAADHLAEQDRVIMAWPYHERVELGYRIQVQIHLDARFPPRLDECFRRFRELRLFGRRERKRECLRLFRPYRRGLFERPPSRCKYVLGLFCVYRCIVFPQCRCDQGSRCRGCLPERAGRDRTRQRASVSCQNVINELLLVYRRIERGAYCRVREHLVPVLVEENAECTRKGCAYDVRIRRYLVELSGSDASKTINAAGIECIDASFFVGVKEKCDLFDERLSECKVLERRKFEARDGSGGIRIVVDALIGTAADRMRIQGRERKLLGADAFPEMFGHNAECRVLQERRVCTRERKYDSARVGTRHLHALPVGAARALDIGALRAMDGEHNIVGRERCAVVEGDVWTQRERVYRAAFGNLV